MTTIAYRAGFIAVDTQTTANNFKDPCPHHKALRLSDGSVVAAIGDLDLLERLRLHLVDPESNPFDAKDVGVGLHFVNRDEIWIYQNNGRYRFAGEYSAWGSGAAPALAALLLGASAEKAIEVAAQIDIYTGGPIDVFELLPVEPE